MKIQIVGGGPAGLYFGILMKKASPAHEIDVYERDGPHDTFGWGIVFSQKTMELLRENDAESWAGIAGAAQSWDFTGVIHRRQEIRMRGNRFYGIQRLRLLNLLQARAEELGVRLHFHSNFTEQAQLEALERDLLIGADGANSFVRRTYQDYFLPTIDLRQNKYTWLGTHRVFDGLTLTFRETAAGLFIAHSYKFSPDTSTFIVEVPPDTWDNSGLARMPEGETTEYLAKVFAEDLHGQPLLGNNFVKWFNFPLIKNKRWSYRNIGLLGDALHTVHFSIGSGTKLALEDAVALAGAFARYGRREERVRRALAAFEEARKPMIDQFQEAAVHSLTWLENAQEFMGLEPVPFAFRLVTRSNRVGYNRLKRQDPAFAAQYDAWLATQPKPGAIPSQFLDLFQKRAFGHLATLMPDGKPQVTSVWVDFEEPYLLINSTRGRQKDRNIERHPEVAIQIPDPDNPDRYLAVRGRVVEVTEEGADEQLDRLAKRYLAREKYPPTWRYPGEVRRIYKIKPEHVTAWEPFG